MPDVVEINARPFEVKRGDTRPKYLVQLKDNLDKPEAEWTNFPLVGDETIFFIMRRSDDEEETTEPAIRKEAIIESAPESMVSFTAEGDDWDQEPEAYDVEFEVIDSEGGEETVPNKGFFKLIINRDLDKHE